MRGRFSLWRVLIGAGLSLGSLAQASLADPLTNQPPVCQVPNDTTILECASIEVCLPVSATSQNPPVTCAVISGPGTISGGNWCYTPTGSGTDTVTIRCTDGVGQFCQNNFIVTYDVNEPPTCTVPNDTTIFLCEPKRICLPFSEEDPDGNFWYCQIVTGACDECKDPNGCKTGGQGLWCCYADHDTTIDVTIRCYDYCREYCEKTFKVTFNINEPPVCHMPGDTTIFLCGPDTVCIPFSATDADGNFDQCVLDVKGGGPGFIRDYNLCFLNPPAGTYHVPISCYDSCGAVCRHTITVTFIMNDSPGLAASVDTIFFTFEGPSSDTCQWLTLTSRWCSDTNWCHIPLPGDPGFIHSITPDHGTTPSQVQVCVDPSQLSRGEYYDTLIFCPCQLPEKNASVPACVAVIVKLSILVNRAPVLAAIGPRSVNEGQDLSFGVSATDPDGTTPTLTAESVPLHAVFMDYGNGTGTFVFDPDYTQAGVYNVRFIASDGALADSELVAITVRADTCITLPPGAVSWWPGDGNANDAVGGNDGSLVNGATFAPGMVGQAFSFDGSDDYVQVPHSSSLDITDAITIEAWVKFNQVDRTAWGYNWQAIVAKDSYVGSLALMLSTVTDGAGNKLLRFYHPGLTPGTTDYDWNSVQAGVWYHVAVTYDGTATRHYIDGTERASAAATGSIATNSNPLRIGISNSERPYPFDGEIDELAIYDRALSAEQIRAIYEVGAAGKCKEPTQGQPPTLRWPTSSEAIPGVSPDTGIASTQFEFAVVYSDSDGNPPLAGYPKVRIDYEGDGLLTGPRDAVYSMWATGTADYVAGRKYLCRTTLPSGSTYRFSFAAFDQPGDSAVGEAAWVWTNGPDVQSDPVDLYLYASDITFSDPTPAVGDTFFVSATIHNNSGTDFSDVPVEVADKFGPIATLLLPSLPAHGTATTTRGFRYNTDAYYTFRFTVDPNNAITEWNETNNSAARGVVIGQPPLPGFIRLLAQTANPNLPQAWVTVSGRADYFGPDSLEQVSGATVTIDIKDYQSFTGYTNDNGDFAVTFRAPLTIGNYAMKVSVTDYTLSKDTTLTLTVVSCLQPLPDLICNLSLSRIPTIVNLDDTTSITSLYVYSLCDDTAYNFWMHLYQDGVIIDSAGPIAQLAPRQAYYPPWQNHPFHFTGVGYHSVSCYADLRNTVPENSEENNQATTSFYLWCDHPDFTPTVPFPQSLAYVGQPTTLYARIYNQGGIAIPDGWGVEPADSFAVRFRVTKDTTFSTEGISWHTVGAFGAWTDAAFGIVFPQTGWYWVTVTADPGGVITECNEGNNEAGWAIYVDDLRVNLQIGYDDVTVSNPDANGEGQSVVLQAVVHNHGNATATNVPVIFRVDTAQVGGTTIIPVIAPYSSQTATSSAPWTVNRSACLITATADPANVIAETNELDNTGSVPAVFELYPVYGGACGYWPMFNVCAAGRNEPVTIYARAQTSAAFNIPGLVSVHFEDRDQDSVVTDLGIVTLSGFNSHRQNMPGASFVYAFSKSGWHTVTATVDVDSQYPECDENNSYSASVWIGFKPDLMVHSEYIDPNPLNPDPGDSVTISVDVYNVGHAVADNVRVAFLMDGMVLGDTVTIDSIPAPPSSNNYFGIQATQKWLATDIPTGLHIVRVVTDADNSIPEENEDNNEATRAVIVGPAPDLWVKSTDIGFSNYYPGVGFPTTITATIHNGGAVVASATVEVYYLEGSDTVRIGTMSLPAVPPAGTAPVSLVWIIGTDSTDVHVAIVSTDPQDFNTTNNQAEKTFRLLLNGDCNKDRVINVQDVVCLVDIVFRGAAPPEPWTSIDVNCDRMLDVRDVVKEVNVAFRGADAGKEFCELAPLLFSGR